MNNGMKKAIVLPGGGSPTHEKYTKVYSLIEELGARHGFDVVPPCMYPGHAMSQEAMPTAGVFDLDSAADFAANYIRSQNSDQDSRSRIICRSLGCAVFLRMAEQHPSVTTEFVESVVLVGPGPYAQLWRFLAPRSPEFPAASRSLQEKLFSIDENTWANLRPIEVMLGSFEQEYSGQIPLILAIGTEDRECPKEFATYLQHLAPSNTSIRIYEGPHAVVESVPGYTHALFG